MKVNGAGIASCPSAPAASSSKYAGSVFLTALAY